MSNMTPLTLAYAIEHKFTPIDCVKYFKPDWSNAECSFFLMDNTCYPSINELMFEQLNKQLNKQLNEHICKYCGALTTQDDDKCYRKTEPEQHTVVGC